MPITILIVEKFGNIKELTLKTYDESELYKKAGYKSDDGFICQAQWNIEELNGKYYSISVFGKTTGRANQENKYEFPPPVDSTLFFGNCIIVNKLEEGSASNLCESEWTSIYEYLYGGFEDIGSEDEDEEDEVDEDDDLPKTKSGYAKDGFVVDEDEDEEDEEEEYEEEEDEDEKSKLKIKIKLIKDKLIKDKLIKDKLIKDKLIKDKLIKDKLIKDKPVNDTNNENVLENVFTKVENVVKLTKSKQKKTDKDNDNKKNKNKEDDNYLECTSELSEESYV